MFEPHEYAITIRKVVIDGEKWFEAKVKELPYVAEYADSFGEAYQLAIDTIQTSMKMFAEKGKSFPPPLKPEDDEYSGRITLRLPKYLHRQIARTAQQEEINFYITSA
ncbi:MAG: toxin-antitoxin system HicB family antitoxin [Pseudomonadota bacterium]